MSNNPLEASEAFYIFEQKSPSSVWRIHHKYKNEDFLIDVYTKNSDGSHSKVVPYRVVAENPDTIVVDFADSEVCGFASILFIRNDINIVQITATPTPTPTVTPTMTPTITPTMTITPTVTVTPTISSTVTPTATVTPTVTTTPTVTPTVTPTTTVTPSVTPTYTPTPTPTASPKVEYGKFIIEQTHPDIDILDEGYVVENARLGTGWRNAAATEARRSGKRQFEYTLEGDSNVITGIISDLNVTNFWDSVRHLGGSISDGYGVGYGNTTGVIFHGNLFMISAESYTVGDVITVAVDLESAQHTVSFYKNGVYMNTVDIPNGRGWRAATSLNASSSLRINTGYEAYKYPVKDFDNKW